MDRIPRESLPVSHPINKTSAPGISSQQLFIGFNMEGFTDLLDELSCRG